MDDVVAEQPADRQIHVILDNLNTHKRNEDWLAAHPNVTFHFTPTSASLNQVEIWFGIFQRKTLNNASFKSIEQLSQTIRAFTVAYNENAAPFVWRKREVRGAQLRNTIVTLRTGTAEKGPEPASSVTDGELTRAALPNAFRHRRSQSSGGRWRGALTGRASDGAWRCDLRLSPALGALAPRLRICEDDATARALVQLCRAQRPMLIARDDAAIVRGSAHAAGVEETGAGHMLDIATLGKVRVRLIAPGQSGLRGRL